MKTLKIGYFADGPWSHGALNLIINDPHMSVSFICARYSKPDPYLETKAKELGISFLVAKNVNSNEFLSLSILHECDLFVSMSFDQILRKSFYSLPIFGTINCHAGKLPFYRGRNILNWALINDEVEFGITVHYIDDGIDTGDIILQRTFPICDQDDYSTLLQTAYRECPPMLFEAIQKIQSGRAERIPQNSLQEQGSVFTQRKNGDELIDWKQTSREIFNFVRALTTPGPCAQTMLDGKLVRISKVEMVQDAPHYKCIPGAILAKDQHGFLVKTEDTYLRVTKWSSESKFSAGKRFLK